MLLAVYGTLRQGDYNHERYLGGYEPIDLIRLERWDMHSLGAYPYITEGKGSILAEIYLVPPEVVFAIARMEMDAGYWPKEIDLPHRLIKGVIFYFPPDPSRDEAMPTIDSGNWISFISKERLEDEQEVKT